MKLPLQAESDLLLRDGWVAAEDPTFVGTLGAIFMRTVDGRCEFALITDDKHGNLSGTVHGGVIMTLLDRVMGVNSKAAIETRAPTAAITVNFLSPAKLGDIIVASCRIRRVGRGTVFSDGEARVGEKLIATACATFVRPFAA